MFGGGEGNTTRKLYYEDAYTREFDAVVTACRETPAGFEILVDQTAFYPEGGGQPADIGTLGGAEVFDVREDTQGGVIHYATTGLAVGAAAKGAVDWERRTELMRHHTAEHIISGIIKRRFGFDNVGFHMGKDCVTIDVNGPLTERQTDEVEQAANRAVPEDIPVTTAFPGPAELSATPYRSKKELEGAVRLVTIPGIDVCACCGLHVARTLEIGVIKIIDWQKYKKGVRLSMTAGERALEDYRVVSSNIRAISETLSAKRDGAANAVDRLVAENGRLAHELAGAITEITRVKAEAIKINKAGFAFVIEENPAFIDVGKYAVIAAQRAGTAAIFVKSGEDSYRYAICGPAETVSGLAKALNSAFNGKGGGRDGFAQGTVRARAEGIRRLMSEQDF